MVVTGLLVPFPAVKVEAPLHSPGIRNNNNNRGMAIKNGIMLETYSLHGRKNC